MRAHNPFRKQLQRIFSLLLVLTLLLPAGNALAYEGGSDPVRAEDKIDADLYAALKQGGMSDFIVVMKDKTDPQLLANRAVLASDGQELPAGEQQELVHNYVVMGLLTEAEESQVSLMDYLSKAEKAGDVEHFKSFYIVNSIAVTGNLDAALTIASYPEVEEIVPDRVIAPPPVEETTVSLMSEEALPKTPWNLTSISQDKVRDELKLDGTGVVVGIIDTGVDLNHPALHEGWRGNDPELAQYSWLDLAHDGKSPVPVDEGGHGTHVCGTIMGRHDDQGNYLGVAPGAQWIAARVFDDHGATTTTLIEAGQWMLAPTDAQGNPHPEQAPDIVNNSWGGEAEDENFFRDILNAWRAAGIVPVFSAGNTTNLNPGGPGSIHEPSNFPEAFTVGALKKDDGLAKFSLRGPSAFADYKPDVSAPGVNIRSSMPGGGYGLMSGTSMACPHVSGVFALLKQANPDATVDQLEKAVRDTCTPLTDTAYVSSPNNGYGYGKVNAYNAVKKVQATGNEFGTFTGHIYEVGEDSDVPVIQHAPIGQMFSSSPSTPVETKASDLGGLATVTLKFAAKGSDQWTSREMKLVSGTKRDGTFLAEIAKSELNEGGMQYQIIATDLTGKTTESEIFQAEVTSGVTIGYKQDFETNTDGIEFGGTTPMWEWGVPTAGPSAAASGEKCVGTNLDGSYAGMIDSIMVLPIIDLSEEKTGGKSAALTFKHWYDLGNYEYAIFETAEVWIAEVPQDNSEPQYQMVRSYKNSNDKWEDEYIDLAPYAGKQIYVMFGFRGDLHAKQQEFGWYIDDIQVQEASSKIPATPTAKLVYKPEGVVNVRCNQIDDPSVTSYRLYRGTSPEGPFTQVAEVMKKELTSPYSTAHLNDSPTPQKGTYYYYATAMIGENESKPTKIMSYTFTQGTPVVTFDFEDGAQGWTSTGSPAWTQGTYEIPESTLPQSQIGSRPSKDVFKGKNEGLGMWATELMDFRAASSTYTLTSGDIDLSQVENGVLYYQNWFNTRGRKGFDEYAGMMLDEDRGYVYFSKDGGETWQQQYALDDTTLYDEGSQGQHRIVNAWYTEHIAIPAEYQVSNFRVKFELQTGAVEGESDCGGWYIDDVMITSNTEPVELASAEETVRPFALTSMRPLSGELRTYGTAPSEEGRLPLDGTITMLETGSKYYAEAGTGVFNFTHPVGSFTAVASCRGYRSETFPVTISATEPASFDFVLQPASKNTVSGIVVDELGNPIADAVAFLTGAEDTFRVNVDGTGEFTIRNVYAGEYLLNVSASGCDSVDIPVTVAEGKNSELGKITLKDQTNVQPLREIAYDDGTPESYVNTLMEGRAAAVLMENNGKAVVESIKLMFGADNRHSSQGRPIQYAIYEKNGFDGLPGRILVDYTDAVAGKDQQWTEIRLPAPVVVDGDFFVVYRQVESPEVGALLTVDENSSGVGHNMRLSNGAWYDADEMGAYMIRASVKPFGEQPPATLKSVSAAPSALTVAENAKVLDTLKSSAVQVTLTYSDGTTKTQALSAYLTDAVVKLDGATVNAATAFSADSRAVTVEKDGKTLKLTLTVTVTPEPAPEGGAAWAEAANLTVDQFLNADGNVGFTVDLKNAKNIYALELQVEGTGAFVSVTGLNGFTVLTKDVTDAGNGTFSGTVRLAYTNSAAKAQHQALTHAGLLDVANFTVTSASEEQPAAMTLTKVTVAGAPDLEHSDMAVVTGGTRTAAYQPMVKYDLDQDGDVDLGDLALAVRCYRASSTDDDWNAKQKGDVNRDGVVSVMDFVEIALHINA